MTPTPIIDAAAPAALRRVARLVAAEGVGTAFLLAAVVGSGIMGERLAAGNVAVALLANTAATAAALYVLISVLGPVSGAHFNPAVTLLIAMRREVSWVDVPAYLIAQVTGAVLGVIAAHLMFEAPVIAFSSHVRAGPAQLFSEFVATLGLLFTIVGGSRHRPSAVPALVACYIGAAYWFTASTSFANPAVTFARSLTDSFSGIRPADVPGFLAAQLLATLVALPMLNGLFGGASHD